MMDYFILALKIIVSASILNVWLIQVYGLPQWMCYLVGALKVILAIGLVASIWYPEFQNIAAFGLAALLTGSVIMHLKINDPFYKSFPALLFLSMCLLITLL